MSAAAQEDEIGTRSSSYKAAAGIALAAVFILIWLALGVGILGRDGDRANLMYAGVLGVGIIGVITARFRPLEMSRALVAMATAQVLVTLIALMAGVHRSGVSPVAEIVGLNGFFVALFLGSAWLFRSAAREQPSNA